MRKVQLSSQGSKAPKVSPGFRLVPGNYSSQFFCVMLPGCFQEMEIDVMQAVAVFLSVRRNAGRA